MDTIVRLGEVPTRIRAAVIVTLVVEAGAVPTFLYLANEHGGTAWYVAAVCGAVAAACAIGTLAGSEAARRTLMALAGTSLVLAGLQLPVLLLVMPVGELLLANSLFVATSAIVLALLSRRPETAPAPQGWRAVQEALSTVCILLLSIVVLVCAGVGLLSMSF